MTNSTSSTASRYTHTKTSHGCAENTIGQGDTQRLSVVWRVNDRARDRARDRVVFCSGLGFGGIVEGITQQSLHPCHCNFHLQFWIPLMFAQFRVGPESGMWHIKMCLTRLGWKRLRNCDSFFFVVFF